MKEGDETMGRSTRGMEPVCCSGGQKVRAESFNGERRQRSMLLLG